MRKCFFLWLYFYYLEGLAFLKKLSDLAGYFVCEWVVYINTQPHFHTANHTAWLGDATISSKTEPRNGSKKEKRSYGKVRNKTMLKILPFIQILCLKQQSNILRCFWSLKFLKNLFSNKLFGFIFRSKLLATAEKDQIKYFARN